ncbi:MAG TPA: helix-turn-helix domain-containing protein [Gemmatimonadales bacterium]|nr:helix-turn-helix domain-containing protein [Gemmatimonadales bacterium]
MRHLLLAAVAPRRLTRLGELGSAYCEWIVASSWAEAVASIRRHPVEMAVVDPLLGGRSGAQEIARLRAMFPSLPLLIYTDLTPPMASALLQLGRAGVTRALFSGIDDGLGTLQAEIGLELHRSASRQVIDALGGVINNLPANIRLALHGMLNQPGAAPTVAELSRRARVIRRTCERCFTRRGLPPPKTVILLARLLYAHRLLLDPGNTVDDVAAKLGYGKTRTLQAHLRWVFGMTAGEARAALTIEQAAAAVTDRFFPKPTRAAS